MSISIEDAKVGALVQTQMPFTAWRPTFAKNDILMIVNVSIENNLSNEKSIYIDVASDGGIVHLLLLNFKDPWDIYNGWWYYLDLVQSL